MSWPSLGETATKNYKVHFPSALQGGLHVHNLLVNRGLQYKYRPGWDRLPLSAPQSMELCFKCLLKSILMGAKLNLTFLMGIFITIMYQAKMSYGYCIFFCPCRSINTHPAQIVHPVTKSPFFIERK